MLIAILGLGLVEMIIIGALGGAVIGGITYVVLNAGKGDDQ